MKGDKDNFKSLITKIFFNFFEMIFLTGIFLLFS